MAQLASLATLIGAGVSTYAHIRQGQQLEKYQKERTRATAAEEAVRREALEIERQARARERAEQLRRTIAATRARLAASGVSPDEGSAAALTRGLARDAAAAQAEDDARYALRLSAGRASLLRPDGSLAAYLRAGQSFGTALRSLLD
ncbi:hypothetical protein [Caldovatus aquaticus]|uniref:Uncharacterized protein n=1 Tax=Caldovatus aquaticus TaxID=2865671 RepID=A0ABS7F6V1_9PROT|nr:hypothetical protein [Caldovatus aquaticus]MBW8271336.1 hypothetical protein [Caldovatus aquaticus]